MPYETMKGYVLSNDHMMRQNNPLSKTKIKTNSLSLHALKLVEATNLWIVLEEPIKKNKLFII